jgi:hypothetical protein
MGASSNFLFSIPVGHIADLAQKKRPKPPVKYLIKSYFFGRLGPLMASENKSIYGPSSLYSNFYFSTFLIFPSGEGPTIQYLSTPPCWTGFREFNCEDFKAGLFGKRVGEFVLDPYMKYNPRFDGCQEGGSFERGNTRAARTSLVIPRR